MPGLIILLRLVGAAYRAAVRRCRFRRGTDAVPMPHHPCGRPAPMAASASDRVRSLRSYKKASSTRAAMTPAPRFSCGEGITYRRYELEAKVVPVELGICRQTSAFRHGSYSPVVSRQRGRLCKARPAAMRPHRQGGLSGVGSRLAAAGRHCRRVGEATSFVGANPCASFSDVECGRNFNTKRFSSNRVGRSIEGRRAVFLRSSASWRRAFYSPRGETLRLGRHLRTGLRTKRAATAMASAK